MSFKNLDLNDAVLKAVHDLGFVEPTPIQTEAIPEIMFGDRDLVGLAQTGTGKTAAFGLPMIQLIDFDSTHTQGVIICPTRELCLQIAKDITSFCKYIKAAKIAAIYGGAGIENQISRIKKGVQIIVATPGRLLDLMRRSVINLSSVNYVVLDEADEMLNMGFKEDIDAILDQTPTEKRIWLFAATMPHEVATIAKKYMHRPVEITIGKKNAGAENIKHIYFIVREKDRYPALKRIIDFHPDIYGLVFCRTRIETQEIAEKLIKDGYNAEALHGDLSQQVREQVMGRYRTKSIQVLVATDVAARGIDVQDITHVINYKLPDEPDNYTHRSGRTGRAGKSGMSVAIINAKENYKLQQIERKSGIKFTYVKVPEGQAVCENQLYAMINKLVEVEVNHAEIGKFLPPVYSTLAGLTKEALIQKFVSLEFNRFLDYYKNTVDINVTRAKKDKDDVKTSRKKETVKSRTLPGKTRRFFMDAGRMDNIVKGTVIRNVCEKSGISADKIGKIEILREFSFFEVASGSDEKVLKAMKGAKIDGREVRIQYAEINGKKNVRTKKKKGH
ncbi:MAG: DEAD/DEAH box helicase [Proteobacteria bacterium]|nr:DEAD/DEAH box helicase [Pseudomonadota bacterium]